MNRFNTVRATYLLESWHPLAAAAEVLAGEQSSGTFVAVPGETEEIRSRFRARVVRVEELELADTPSLPGAHRPPGATMVNCGVAVIEFPLDNLGGSLTTLLTATMGNLFELRELAGCRLLDLDLHPSFTERYPGPAFGVEGTRRLLGVPKEVMVGTIVKPSIGLRPDELAALVQELIDAGIDFIKDDELMANPEHSPLAARVEAVMDVVNRCAERDGRKVMFAFNITDDVERLERNYDLVRSAGGTCVMAVVNVIGLGGLAHLRSFCDLPIHGHRAGIGMLMRHPALGIDFRAFQKLARLAGADHLHTNGMDNKFYETNEEVRDSIRAVQEPLLGGYQCLPVLSSGQWAGTAPRTHELVGSTDLLMLAGGGIMAHPLGIAAGVRSIREGWQAALAGVPLAEYAASRPALAAALAKFG